MAGTCVAVILYALFTVPACSVASESDHQLTTTLYPVNRTLDLKQQESNVYNNNVPDNNNDHRKIIEQVKGNINNKSDDTLNPLNDGGMTNVDNEEPKNKEREQKQNDKTNESEETATTDGQIKDDDSNGQISDGKSSVVANGVKNEITTWSLETNYSQAEEQDNEKDFKEEPKQIIKEFRPSPHLGSFYDEDTFALTTQASLVPWSPFTNPSGVMRPHQELYKLDYRKPIDAPYKFEANPAFPDPTYWKHHTGLEARPTDSVPVKTPAGGLYKSPGVFKHPPINSQEYGLSYKEGAKETHKKGVNPWKSFLQLASALLPVGLLVSALTPSVVTLQSADNTPAPPYYANRITRRVQGSRRLPVISEACKRRLLCELHAPRHEWVDHYNEQTPTGHKHCYKLQCEDPTAMMKVLRFLMTQPPPGSPPGAGGSSPGTVVPLG